DCAEGASNGREGDTALEVEFSIRRIKQGVYEGEGRPQSVRDVVVRDHVVVERLTDEAFDARPVILKEARHRGMERAAAVGIKGHSSSVTRHLLHTYYD